MQEHQNDIDNKSAKHFRKTTQQTIEILCNVEIFCYGDTVVIRASNNKRHTRK